MCYANCNDNLKIKLVNKFSSDFIFAATLDTIRKEALRLDNYPVGGRASTDITWYQVTTTLLLLQYLRLNGSP